VGFLANARLGNWSSFHAFKTFGIGKIGKKDRSKNTEKKMKTIKNGNNDGK
jgi:hypothetical protein